MIIFCKFESSYLIIFSFQGMFAIPLAVVFMLVVVRKIGEDMTCNLVKPSLEAGVQRLGRISAIEQHFSNCGLLPNNGDEINL